MKGYYYDHRCNRCTCLTLKFTSLNVCNLIVSAIFPFFYSASSSSQCCMEWWCLSNCLQCRHFYRCGHRGWTDYSNCKRCGHSRHCRNLKHNQGECMLASMLVELPASYRVKYRPQQRVGWYRNEFCASDVQGMSMSSYVFLFDLQHQYSFYRSLLLLLSDEIKATSYQLTLYQLSYR